MDAVDAADLRWLMGQGNVEALVVVLLDRRGGPVERLGRQRIGDFEDDVVAPEQPAEHVVELGDSGACNIVKQPWRRRG
ncbi:MAG: hypothetical protein ACRDS0_04965 [Pseudonocardiaceae bacterium]